jgi:RNA polymerase sigma-70 factor (ECF subfamily)
VKWAVKWADTSVRPWTQGSQGQHANRRLVDRELDKPDFDTFFNAEFDRLVRSIRLLLRNTHDAEDIAQESFVRVLERWDRVAAMDSPLGYLYQVALNLSRRQLRRNVRENRIVHRWVPGRDPADAPALSDVRRALQSMPKTLREILILADWVEMNTQEMSQALGIRPGAVRVRLHRARQAFRENWGGNE